VLPPYYLTELKTVAMYRKTLAKYFPASSRALRRGPGARPETSREGVDEGLIRSIAAIQLDDSGRDHAGLKAVIPTVIRGGRAVPFTDWAMLK
jgi:hypothetical protein